MRYRPKNHALFQERAQEMRQQPSDTESMVWNKLRNRQIGGFQFRRQHPLGNYIADFYCCEASLVVELDGATHEQQRHYDLVRDAWMRDQGIQVMRISNGVVLEAFEAFLDLVLKTCLERSGTSIRSSSPSP